MTDRVTSALAAEPWAILPDWLHAIWALALRRPDASALTADQDWRDRDLAAIIGAGPTRLNGARYAMVSDGVAVIPVFGPLFPRANMMTEMSGATSAGLLRQDIRLARADRDVGGIMLLMDTPGGAVSGINAVADAVFAARREKPIMAHIAGMAASAGYWIASSAGEITMERTGMAGSIGVVHAIPHQVEPDANGEIVIEIVSSNAPNKRPDPTTDDGADRLRATLDAIEAQFIADVARGRGVGAKVVREQFGRGGVEIGAAAVERGMADRIASYEASFEALRRRVAADRRVKALAS